MPEKNPSYIAKIPIYAIDIIEQTEKSTEFFSHTAKTRVHSVYASEIGWERYANYRISL